MPSDAEGVVYTSEGFVDRRSRADRYPSLHWARSFDVDGGVGSERVPRYSLARVYVD